MSTSTEQRPGISESVPAAATTVRAPAERPSRRMLLGVVAVLTTIVVGLGAWLIAERTTSDDSPVSNEIQQLLDDYHRAWNSWDGDAYLELVTEDGSFVMPGRTTTPEQQAMIIEGLERFDWHVETVGEPIVAGDGPWYVTQAHHLTGTAYPEDGHQGISTFTIVDDNGTLRISQHLYTGTY